MVIAGINAIDQAFRRLRAAVTDEPNLLLVMSSYKHTEGYDDLFALPPGPIPK